MDLVDRTSYNRNQLGTSSAGGTEFTKMDTEDAQQTISLINGLDDSPDTGDLQNGYGLFANDELVDVSLIMNSAHSATVGDYIIDNVCDVRKDCLVFLSPQRASAVLNEGMKALTLPEPLNLVRTLVLLRCNGQDGSTCMTSTMTDTFTFL